MNLADLGEINGLDYLKKKEIRNGGRHRGFQTGGLMGKPGTGSSDPRFIHDLTSLDFTIS